MSGDTDTRRNVVATARLSVFAAVLLIVIKLGAGLASGSLALVAEAAHSGTDLAAALLTLTIVRIAVRPPDDEHPYGHGKAEHLAALAEASLLLLLSAFVGYHAVDRLASGDMEPVHATVWLFATLAVVIAIDVTRTVTLLRAAERHNSAALHASAMHFASDLGGTIAVIVGLVLVAAGWEQGDPAAALVVAALVAYAAWRLIYENANVLMDRAPTGVEQMIRAAVAEAEPGVTLTRVRVRTAGGRYFVEAVAGYQADAGLSQGHAVADEIERVVEDVLPESEVVVHLEPSSESHDLRARASAAALTVRGVREVHDVRVVRADDQLELSLHIKLPASLALAEAHDVASAVERAITTEVPELGDVHTHIEPLSVEGVARPADQERAGLADEIEQLVNTRTGHLPVRLTIRRETEGLVVLLTVIAPSDHTLDEAHDLATDVERAVRALDPGVAAVIVHTEPDTPAPGGTVTPG